MKESDFQKSLKKELKERFPGCIITKNDPGYIQGFPDLLILFGKLWATLEIKRSKKATRQPNQTYYEEKLNKMGFSAIIFPENKEEILNALERYFRKS